MKKKTTITISLILTIISMIYMFLVYYGILRYVIVHFRDARYYSEGYTKLDKADENERVVVSFTATEDRLEKLNPFINSLLDQTVRVDEIAMSIPYKHMGKVPKHLKKLISVYGYTKNYDDTGNLIPVILREGEALTKIIIVQDDMIYGKDFLEDMISVSEKNPKKIVYGKSSKDPKWGVLIKPQFFDTKVADYIDGTGCGKWLGKCSKVEGVSANYSETYRSWRK